jgi:hypothetical protein
MEQLSHLSMTLWLKETGIFSSFVAYNLLTTGMKLIGRTKCSTAYGRYERCLKFKMAHFPNFTTIPKIWLLTKLLLPSKEGWFSNGTYQRNGNILASKFSNFVTRMDIRITWKYTWGGMDNTQHSTWQQLTCDRDRTDEEHRTWAQIILGQFIFFPWMIWWLGKETDLLLWDCKAEQ